MGLFKERKQKIKQRLRRRGRRERRVEKKIKALNESLIVAVKFNVAFS